MRIAQANGRLGTLLLCMWWAIAWTVAVQAQPLEFTYTQTDSNQGSGFISGTIDGVFYSAELPPANVSQVDSNTRFVPENYVGYIDGWQEAQPGNPFGVHLGWEGELTLRGDRVLGPFSLEVFELTVPLVLDAGAGAGWRYAATLTDDDGNGNDAFGENLRIAGWLGEKGSGHRHSASVIGDFAQGQIDSIIVVGSHDQVGGNGIGDPLGIAISLRNFNNSDGPGRLDADGDGSGVIYVDDITWQGGLTVDTSVTPPVSLGISLAADLNNDGTVTLADLSSLTGQFNREGTTRAGGGDLTGDRQTDLYDFVLFRDALADGGLSGPAVPEPDVGRLTQWCLLGLLPMLRRRRTAILRSATG